MLGDEARAESDGTGNGGDRQAGDLGPQVTANGVEHFEADGDRFAAQRERFFREIVEVGFRYAQRAFERVAALHGRHLDAADLASVALSALVNHRRTQWTFGVTVDGLDDERFLDAWTTLVWSAIGPRADDIVEKHEGT